MNVIAGVLIGVANDDWITRLLVPLAWGALWCIYVSIAHAGAAQAYSDQQLTSPRYRLRSLSSVQVFYLVEYATAVATSLPIALVSGALRDLLS